MNPQQAPVDPDLRAAIVAMLELDPGDPDGAPAADEDLVEWGLDSLSMMSVSRLLAARGVERGFAELAARPTLAAWSAGLSPGPGGDGPDPAPRPEPGPYLDPAPDVRLPLAPMQHAFWLGRQSSQRLGGVGAHFHHEFTGSGIDPDRLERAVRAVLARHAMLRSSFHDDGTFSIAAQSPWPGLTVHDLRGAGDPAAEADEVRDRMSNRTLDIAAGHVLDVHLSLLPSDECRLHVGLEMVVADAMSFRTVLADLARLYDRPDEPLPPLRYGFAQYLADRAPGLAQRAEHDRDHWLDRVADLPDAPELPLGAWALGDAPRRATRRHGLVDPADRATLEAAAHRRGLTPAMVLATVFAEVVGRWSAHPRFLLNLPVFGREPLHPDVDLLVGDFTDSVLLEVDLTATATVTERTRAVTARFRADAARGGWHGLDVLRELGRRRGHQVLAPVVFTSALSIGELVDDTFRRSLGSPSWIISQGPQVWLDTQVVEFDGGLLVNWDAAEDSFAPGVLDAMADAFAAAVARLVRDTTAWEAPLFPVVEEHVAAPVDDLAVVPGVMDDPARVHGPTDATARVAALLGVLGAGGALTPSGGAAVTAGPAALVGVEIDADGVEQRPELSRAELAAVVDAVATRAALGPDDRVLLRIGDLPTPGLPVLLAALRAGAAVEIVDAAGTGPQRSATVVAGRVDEIPDRVGAHCRALVLLDACGDVALPAAAPPLVLALQAHHATGVPTVIRDQRDLGADGGVPVPGLGVRIVDTVGRERPDHVVGDIVIAAGVPGAAPRRTGHRGRRAPGGTIEVVGRDHDVVEVGGHRYAREAPAAVAATLPGVAHAALGPRGTLVLAAPVPPGATAPDPRAPDASPVDDLVDAALLNTLLVTTGIGREPRGLRELVDDVAGPQATAAVLAHWVRHLTGRGLLAGGHDAVRLTAAGTALAGGRRWTELLARAGDHAAPPWPAALDGHLRRLPGFLRGTRELADLARDPVLGPLARAPRLPELPDGPPHRVAVLLAGARPEPDALARLGVDRDDDVVLVRDHAGTVSEALRHRFDLVVVPSTVPAPGPTVPADLLVAGGTLLVAALAPHPVAPVVDVLLDPDTDHAAPVAWPGTTRGRTGPDGWWRAERCGDAVVDPVAVRAALARRLPAALAPSTLLVVSDPPRRPDGTLDRGALTLAASGPDAEGHEPHDTARGPLEGLLVRLWGELLERTGIRRGDDFFALGGDSLIATRLVRRLREAGFDRTRISDVFAHPVLADHAGALAEPDPLGTPPSTAPSTAGVVADPASAHEPFAPTEVQRAYWLGRDPGFTLGGVGCWFYREYDLDDLDVGRLERALRSLVIRHDMLRAVLDPETGDQRVLPAAVADDVAISVVDVPGGAGDEARAAMREECSHRLVDTARWPLFDVRGVRTGRTTRLAVGLDATVVDALSVLIFYAELSTLYADPDVALPPLRVTFRDLLLAGATPPPDELERARRYWWARLDDLPRPPRLPLAVEPARVGTPRFVRHTDRLGPPAWSVLRDRARRHGVTPAAVLVTAYAEVLARWSGGAPLSVMVTLFDRPATHPDADAVIGDFTSLVLLAHEPVPGAGWARAVAGVQERLWADIDHRAVSAIEVLRELARRDGVPERTAPVVFTSALGVGDRVPGTGAGVFDRPVWGISQTPQVWLDHQVADAPDGGIELSWDVVDGLFPPGLVADAFGAYVELLDRLCDPQAPSWEQPAVPALPEATRRARHEVGDTAALQRVAVLHTEILGHAHAHPGRIAVVSGLPGEPAATTLTYGELADRARRVAGGLRAAGIGEGDAVAVTLPRGPDQVVAVLGVLSAGAHYVPIGVDQPAARRARMHRRAGVVAVLGEPVEAGVEAGDAPGGDPDPVPHLHLAALVAASSPVDPVATDPDSTAYVIFTSGSTGEPKGVEVTHRSARNTCEDLVDRYGLGPGDRVLAVSALDFDLSVFDLFGLLSAGGAVITVEQEHRRDPWRWRALAAAHGATVWNSVPALLDMLLTATGAEPAAAPLRLALLSGDWVGLDLPGRLRAHRPGCRFVALGGATEAAIWSNAYEVEAVDPAWASVPYGYPLRNQRFRVVDERGRDCPDHVPGELWIGGTGVAVGYRGDPRETAARFVLDEGGRWYRTGDRGCYRPGGRLEFLGREDRQVQLRGFRVELGEVEAALAEHPGVDRAFVVVVGASEGAPRLLAAVLPAACRPHDEPDRAPGREKSAGQAVAATGSRAQEARAVEHLLSRLVAPGPPARGEPPVVGLWRRWLVDRAVLAPDGGPGPRLPEARAAGCDATAETRRAGQRLDDLAAIVAGTLDALTLLDDPVLAPDRVLDAHPALPGVVDAVVDTIVDVAATGGAGPPAVVEIGARTGRTARRVLDGCVAREVAVDYTALDASTALASTARGRLADHGATVRVTDPATVDEDLLGAFDVVVAHGALHTVADPRQGLATAALLLAPGGTLVAVEPTALAPIGLLTAALLDRGFDHLDAARRAHGSPMLAPDRWTALLRQEGWLPVHDEAWTTGDGELALLLARRPAGAPPTPSALREHLARRVPGHMLPERITVLTRAPLTANGKVDRAAIAARLDRADTPAPTPGGTAPEGAAERLVAALWAEVLGVAPGREDDFFALGGDSLLATRFVGEARRRYGLTVPMRGLFEAPVLRAVAALIAADVATGPGDGDSDDVEEGTL